MVIVPALLLSLFAGCSRSAGATPQATEETGFFLTITEPADGFVASISRIEIKGRTRPDAVVSVNDAGTIADSAGDFSITINLQEGTNIIEAVASDVEGNESRVTLTLGYTGG